jgi:hypothetical protein
MDELMMFPNGPHDDQVDSLTQALHYLNAHQMCSASDIRPIGGNTWDEGAWMGERWYFH